jgi:uncharacterized protein (TIGR03435 family)
MKYVALLAFVFASANGQEFEVASIRPSALPTSQRIRVTFDGGPGSTDPTRFTCRNCSLSILVMRAYNVEYHQVAGLGSRASELYDIVAKIAEGATKQDFQLMLQELLRERFKMTIHRETREMQAYELVVAKNGPKIRESSPETSAEGSSSPPGPQTSQISLDRDGFPVLPAGKGGYASVKGRARMQVFNETMDQLSSRISNQLDMPVANATGLAGRYDFSLYWAGDTLEPMNDGGPSLFSALESQLGLRLIGKKAHVTIIVVDHVDRVPSEN